MTHFLGHHRSKKNDFLLELSIDNAQLNVLSMKNLSLKFLHLFISVLIIWINACTISKSGSPHGTAEGYDGRKPTLLTYDNARVRCGHKELGNNEFDLNCYAMVVDPNSNEYLADSIAEGTQLTWHQPIKLSGPEVTNLSCSESSDSLSQACHFESHTISPLKFRTELEITDTPTQQTKLEYDETIIFVSVSVYGLVPAVSTSYAPLPQDKSRIDSSSLSSESSNDSTEAIPSGFQTREFNPFAVDMEYTRSLCVDKDTVYFGTSEIYQVRNQKLIHYAGSTNINNYHDYSHRKRIKFGQISFAACQDGELLIYDSADGKGRILKLHLSGQVSLITDKITGYVREIKRFQSNWLYLVTNSKIFKIDITSGDIQDIIPPPMGCETPAVPTTSYYNSIAVTSEHLIYLLQNKDCIISFHEGSETGTKIAGNLFQSHKITLGDDGTLYLLSSNTIHKFDKAHKMTLVAGGGTKYKREDYFINSSCETAPVQDPLEAELPFLSLFDVVGDSIYVGFSDYSIGIIKIQKKSICKIQGRGFFHPPSEIVYASDQSLSAIDGLEFLNEKTISFGTQLNEHTTITETADQKGVLETIINNNYPSGNGYILKTDTGVTYYYYLLMAALFEMKNGEPVRIAGNGSYQCPEDNPHCLTSGMKALDAPISYLADMTFDSKNNLYYLDPINSAWGKIYPDPNDNSIMRIDFAPLPPTSPTPPH